MSILTPLAAALSLQVAAPPSPGRVELYPARAEIQVGQTVAFGVRAYDGAGHLIASPAVRWLSVTPELLTVTEAGEVTALRPGEGRIAVVVDGATTFHELRVPDLPVSALRASALGPVRVGIATPLEVSALDAAGGVVDVALEYESLDPDVARVDRFGSVVGLRPGEALIRISAAGAIGEVRVTVEENPAARYEIEPAADAVRTGDVVRLRAVGRDRDGGLLADGPYAVWSVAGSGAQIDSEGAEGVFVAEEPGTYRVSARLGPSVVEEAVIEVTRREHSARVEVVGHGAATTHHSGDTWVFEGVDGRDYAYIGTFLHDWMKVWDVSDPAGPVLVDSMQLDARRINDVKIHPNNRIGILTREGASSRRNGVVVLDLSRPARPRILSEYTETVSGGVHNVWIRGDEDLVYACHNGTGDLHIIDISDPGSPREVGRWGLDRPFKTLHDVIVQDGYAYLSYWDDGVVVLDVGAGTHGGTPTAPAFVSQYSYPQGNTHVAWRSGRYLFVGDEIFPDDWDADRPIEARGYIHVLDMADIEHPREVARYEVPEAGAHNVWVEDDRLYVGYYQAGLRVVDVSGELRGDLYRQGREIGFVIPLDDQTKVANWPMTWGAQVFKGHVFTADLNSGLWVAKVVDERPVS
ncbi:MAG TPA: hypothetical protein VML95_04780 [Longimicrobiales bacterium]|nr:hypothetical protein [Longimicrobiales bacterium]